MTIARYLQHYLFDPLLAVLVGCLQLLFFLLPFRAASNIGGYLASAIGQRLAISRKARKNLLHIWPDMPQERQDEIVRQVWDNLGRNFAEYPSLGFLKFDGSDVAVQGAEQADALIRSRPVILLTGHIGNWEILPYHWAHQGWHVNIIYRRANNPYVDWIIQKIRSGTGHHFAAKGREASKQMIESLSLKGHVALLMDQRMSDGEEIDFLGKSAMTGTGWIKLVLRYNAAIVPVRCMRGRDGDPCRFELIYDNPILPEQLNLPDSQAEAVRKIALLVNQKYAEWISAEGAAGQWLWLHRRWGRV